MLKGQIITPPSAFVSLSRKSFTPPSRSAPPPGGGGGNCTPTPSLPFLPFYLVTAFTFLPSYLLDILHIDVFFGHRHVADDSQVQRVDDLGVWRHHAVVQLGLVADVEEPRGELPDAVPLPVHEEAAAVGVDQGAEPLQNLEHHLLHVDVFLHVFDQLVHDLAFFKLGTQRRF